MILREFLSIAAGNLWRLKLRTALTISGVVIGVGALTTFLSYAVGIQESVAAQFRSLSLLNTLHVMPAGALGTGPGRGGPEDGHDYHDPDDPDDAGYEGNDANPDETAAPGGPGMSAAAAPDSAAPVVLLDDAMLARIAQLKGVTFVYPQDTFDARLEWRGTTRSVTAQILPASYIDKRNIGKMLAGRFFAADSAREVVLSRDMVTRLGSQPDSIVGDTIRLHVANRLQLGKEVVLSGLRSLELPEGFALQASRLMDMFVNRMGPSELALTVCGVAEIESGFGFRLNHVLLPPGPAQGIDRLSFSDPFELLSKMQAPASGYALAVVTLDRRADAAALADSIEALGLRTFSFAGRLNEMRKMFLIFDLIVGLIGTIALVVAALGIVNTMVMSITERTREIGILKALGAEDQQVRSLFLVETGLIGLAGSLLGVTLGWGVSRILSLIAKRIMTAQGVPAMEFFRMPIYLVLGALAFGVGVSLIAGLYPAARAARTNPVQALRHD
jgi:putative ABC transport system permease protein